MEAPVRIGLSSLRRSLVTLIAAGAMLGVPAVAAAGAQRELAASPRLAALEVAAHREGSVRVIIRLDLAFSPEGGLTADARAAQRSSIRLAADALVRELTGTEGRVIRRYAAIPFVAMELTPTALDRLRRSSLVRDIQEDRLAAPALAESAPLVQADQMWGAGFTGSGWTVAVLDTGVETTHPFLAGKVVEEACYALGSDGLPGVGDCPDGSSSQTGAGSGVPCTYSSACFHGTHVAGIAAGSGATFSGVARDADVMSVQVFSQFTGVACGGQPSPCPRSWTSDQLAGLQRVYTLATTTATSFASINLSLGGGRFFSDCDGSQSSMKAAIDNLRSVGIATAIASGNDEWVDSISAPACISTAVSVGSTTKSDVISPFSNMATMVSLLAPGSSINSSTTGGGFAIASGTSMATPHVAGAWALMRQVDPTASIDAVLGRLQSTGLPVSDTRSGGTVTRSRIRVADAGHTLLSVAKAGTGQGTVVSAPPGIDCGGVCDHVFTWGTPVTLSAVAADGSGFTGWSGAGCSGTEACVVTMGGDRAVTATFALPSAQPAPQSKSVLLLAKPKKVQAGDRVRLTATVSPCQGHEGDEVQLFRGSKKIATKATNDACVARFKVKMKKTSRFRAISPQQDNDHLEGRSKKVKVRVV